MQAAVLCMQLPIAVSGHDDGLELWHALSVGHVGGDGGWVVMSEVR